MAVISLTITESDIQLVAGIPKSITVEASIASTVFYTLDGTTPTVSSSIYVDKIVPPTNYSYVTLKLFATNGSDSSDIVTLVYGSDFSQIKKSHSSIPNAAEVLNRNNSQYPFGDNSGNLPVMYGEVTGIIADKAEVTNVYYDGYDSDGYAIGGRDEIEDNYDFIWSETNRVGERGHGIGTLPSKTTIRPTPNDQESSSINNRFFNPKALVIYQDLTQDNPNEDINQLNRQFFSLPKIKGNDKSVDVYTTAFEGNRPSGSMLRSQHNPKDNTITYYYFDSISLRWVISKQPYTYKTGQYDYSQILTNPRHDGVGSVHIIRPFGGRRLI